MSSRGLYTRDGEVLGYMVGERIYDVEDQETGRLDGKVVYDRDGERRWLIEGDAIMDLRGNVIGYLGDRNPHHTED